MEPGKHLNHLSYEVIGAAIEVHRLLGPGYSERLYEDAMAIELTARAVPFERQPAVTVAYKDHEIGSMRLDLLVDKLLVVELKSVEAIIPVHQAQLISYLRATRLTLGLLINFNVPVLRSGVKRVVLT